LKLAVSKMFHHLNAVERHRSLRLAGVVREVRRLAGIAVAAQVTHHQGELFGEIRRDQAPGDQRLWRTVEHQHGRPGASYYGVDLRA